MGKASDHVEEAESILAVVEDLKTHEARIEALVEALARAVLAVYWEMPG